MRLYILIVPFTLGIAVSVIDKFQHIIEEGKIVVGNPVLISNKPSAVSRISKVAG
ncbi:MAG: hypothetical protein WBZ36_28950 [Candidatus Nitrosopolaris sp.]